MTVPIRTCVGCRRRSPQPELLRFGVRDGILAPGRTLPGRGAYTCRHTACFEQAVARGAFARALRRPVWIEPGLARLYTDGDG
jgi:N utilization substance protein A